MLKSYQNGDVVLKDATLTNSNSRVNILGQLGGFDIFEDMAKPTVYATVHLYDAINLLGKFPIIGEEILTLSFETPGMSAPATYRFAVYEVSNIQQSDNRTGLGYTLKCVSEEHMLNGMVEVHQSFLGTLSDVVRIVSTGHLRTTKRIALEETKGVQTVVSPKWTPLECIDFARKNAVSPKYPSSSYVFFENQSGFSFKTVEALIDEGRSRIGSRVFTFVQNVSAVPQDVAYRSVIEFEHIKRPNTITASYGETIFSETETFDMFTKSTRKAEFRIDQQFSKYTPADQSGAAIPFTTQFLRRVDAQDPTRIFMIRDKSRADDFVQDAAASRASYTALLNDNIVRCLVHGDSGLRAGDVITLKLPEIVGTTGRRREDELYSGNYIILRLRHIVYAGPKSRHEIAFDAAKVGVRA